MRLRIGYHTCSIRLSCCLGCEKLGDSNIVHIHACSFLNDDFVYAHAYYFESCHYITEKNTVKMIVGRQDVFSSSWWTQSARNSLTTFSCSTELSMLSQSWRIVISSGKYRAELLLRQFELADIWLAIKWIRVNECLYVGKF